MSLQLDVDGHDIDAALESVRELGAQGERAAARTVRKTTVWAASQAAHDIAKRSRVPLRALTKGGSTGRGKRVRSRLPVKGELSGSVWIGYDPIKAAYAGKLRQLTVGAAAGVHRFPGAFVATLRSGHQSVLRRVTQARAPVSEEVVQLQVAQEVMQDIQSRGVTRLRDVLFDELNYEVNVKK